jgi:hypothetical protein
MKLEIFSNRRIRMAEFPTSLSGRYLLEMKTLGLLVDKALASAMQITIELTLLRFGPVEL